MAVLSAAGYRYYTISYFETLTTDCSRAQISFCEFRIYFIFCLWHRVLYAIAFLEWTVLQRDSTIPLHYNDVIMSAMASQTTSLANVY